MTAAEGGIGSLGHSESEETPLLQGRGQGQEVDNGGQTARSGGDEWHGLPWYRRPSVSA